MTQLRCVVFGVENVLVPPGGDASSAEAILNETGKLVRYLRSRNVDVAVLSNRQWNAKYDDGTRESLEAALKKVWNVEIRWLRAGPGRDVATKQTAQAMDDICKMLQLTKPEIVFVGNTKVDMYSAVNGDVLFLNAQWHCKTVDHGFEFTHPWEVARFIDVFCLREHLWYFSIEDGSLRVYALAPYSTREDDSAAYSYDFLKAVKDELGDGADFWAKYLCTSMYFSGLYQHVQYIAPYPKHTAGEYPKVLASPMTRFSKCFRITYIPNLVIRHTTARESKTNRSQANHVEQINTININRNPQRKPGEAYKSYPIKGKTVVVLDDITTEGYSLDTARLYLNKTGATVICVSLLKTINRGFYSLPDTPLPSGPFAPNQLPSTPTPSFYPYRSHISDAEAAKDLSSRLRLYKTWRPWPPV